MAIASEPSTHVVAGLQFLDAREVIYIDCVCGRRVRSLAEWKTHLAGHGQHPEAIRLGPRLEAGTWASRRSGP